jgi:hypothetical protein
MATPEQKAFRALQFEKYESVVSVQWAFRRQFKSDPSFPNSIRRLLSAVSDKGVPLAAAETITPDLLIRVWQELDYRLDVCRVTKGAHIDRL